VGMKERVFRSGRWALVAGVASVLALAAAPVVAAAQRMPIVGCFNLSRVGSSKYPWTYAPTGYCATSSNLTGIDHATWSGWGKSKTTANGGYVDGLGFRYPATITAYDKVKAKNYVRKGSTVTYYRKIHVVAAAALRGGIIRGPFNITTIDTPSRTLLCGHLDPPYVGFAIRATAMTCGGAKSLMRTWGRNQSCHTGDQAGQAQSKTCRINGFKCHADNPSYSPQLTDVNCVSSKQQVYFERGFGSY
jgi:hypothetical protein